MNSSVKLKVKISSECAVINLSTNSTIKQLFEEIRKAIDIGNEDMDLMTGFPPKPISKNLDLTLSDVKIVSGDCIILKKAISQANCDSKRLKLDFNNVKDIENTDSLVQSQHKIGATILTRQTIPSDNSCLFASIYYCLHGASLEGFDSYSERQLICGMLLSQPDQFDSAFLEGKSPELYCDWIMDKNRWGGSIELHVLSLINEVEIDVVNIKDHRIDRFGEDKNYSSKILILYDGIHYDSIAREDINSGVLVTKFDIYDYQVMEEAKQLAKEMKSSKQYTDLYQLNIICRQCNLVMVGETAIVAHANSTGHSNFGEIVSE